MDKAPDMLELLFLSFSLFVTEALIFGRFQGSLVAGIFLNLQSTIVGTT